MRVSVCTMLLAKAPISFHRHTSSIGYPLVIGNLVILLGILNPAFHGRGDIVESCYRNQQSTWRILEKRATVAHHIFRGLHLFRHGQEQGQDSAGVPFTGSSAEPSLYTLLPYYQIQESRVSLCTVAAVMILCMPSVVIYEYQHVW